MGGYELYGVGGFSEQPVGLSGTGPNKDGKEDKLEQA